MKITMDIPDRTVCAFLCYVYCDGLEQLMSVHSFATDELREGAQVDIRPSDREQEDGR